MLLLVALVLLLIFLLVGGVLLVHHLLPTRLTTGVGAALLRSWRGHSPLGWDDGMVALAPLSRADRVPPQPGERCDRCPTAAVAAAYLPGGVLLLCGHHGREYESVLQAQGAVIVGSLSLAS
jgi:hypothetical protein